MWSHLVLSAHDVRLLGALEEVLELSEVQRRGHDDEPEIVGTLGVKLLQEAEEHVGVQRALVGLI
eukprot:1196190-Prorocentrum_minimum.AAC.4